MDALIDECDYGHMFAKLPDHPTRNGLARCPHCMAQGLDAARKFTGQWTAEDIEKARNTMLNPLHDAARQALEGL